MTETRNLRIKVSYVFHLQLVEFCSVSLYVQLLYTCLNIQLPLVCHLVYIIVPLSCRASVVDYHLLLRREAIIPMVNPLPFWNMILGSVCAPGTNAWYTHDAYIHVGIGVSDREGEHLISTCIFSNHFNSPKM